MMSAPRPVRTPLTDVTIRVPCSVVVKSCTAWRSARRVGEEVAIPRAQHDVPAAPRQLVRELLAITRADHVAAGLCPIGRRLRPVASVPVTTSVGGQG
jgi:hypothetical protein